MSLIDLQAFQAAPVAKEPFEHMVVLAFLRPEALASIHRDFPQIEQGGSFPLAKLEYGDVFGIVLEKDVEHLQRELRLALLEELAAPIQDGVSIADEPENLVVDLLVRPREQMGGIVVEIPVIPPIDVVYGKLGPGIQEPEIRVIL